MHASLVMQDKETDSYWSIMTGDALAGELKGEPLVELPWGTKAQWKDWKAKHPETLVLSVEGKEHVENNPYDNYFTSPEGFRGARAVDNRLRTKEPIYAFQLGGKAFAIPYANFVDGATFRVAGKTLFFYRPEDAALFSSTLAFEAVTGSFEQRDGVWTHTDTQATFDPGQRRFVDAKAGAVQPFAGFDTFWFNWSMTHPEAEVVTAGR